jgi:hypothetical protein
MRVFAVGQSPTGVIAIGQIPTGVIAIGQGATGVIAIGQLARGMIAIGQLALGVIAFGQLSIGVLWSGGMLSVGALEGPTLLGAGLFGRWRLRDLRRLRFRSIERREGPRSWVRLAAFVAIGALVWFVALQPLLHDLLREGGILRDEPGPRVLR